MSSFNFERERDMAAKVCIHMEGKKTTISNPAVSGISTFSLVRSRSCCGCSNLLLKFNLSFNFAFRAKIRTFRMIFPTGLPTVQTDILPHKSRYIS